jgi:hypothetical protein
LGLVTRDDQTFRSYTFDQKNLEKDKCQFRSCAGCRRRIEQKVRSPFFYYGRYHLKRFSYYRRKRSRWIICVLVSIVAALAACAAIIIPIVLLKMQHDSSTTTTTASLMANQQSSGTVATQTTGSISLSTALPSVGTTSK